MRCSVVIPVHNRASLTRQCLETILGDAEFREHAEVVVVDDGSSDGTAALLRELGDEIQVVTHAEATGFATACNDGAAAAKGEDVLFLNNDTIPVAGWLTALLDYADAHPEAAVVGAKLLFPNDTIQHAGLTIDEDRNPRHIYAGFPADHPAVNKSRRCPVVTAACAFFRRGPFEQAGGFDTAFTNGFEDVDLCLRLGESGHEIHYCHESVVYHLEMATRDFRDELPNLDLYRRRWAHKVQPDAISRYLEDGLIRIEYGVRYPFSLYVSPLLAVVEEDDREREAERVLAERAHEITRLLRENVQLRVLAAEAGLEPARVELSPPKAQRPASPRAALFASGAYGEAMRYRCDHHVEQLEQLGATADSRWLHELPLSDVVDAYGCFVLHRVPADEHVAAFVKAAHHHAKAVVYDTDELVFDPNGDDEERRHAQLLAAADAVFVATEPLAGRARSLSENVFVVPSVAGREQLRLADEAIAARPPQREDEIRIAYVSGSPAHARDLLEIADELVSALDESKSARLLLVGAPDLGSRLDPYADRVERLPVLPWRRVPALLAGVDAVVAPRERENPAAEARPALEWLEAALVGVPTVASPTPDFRRVIEPDATGLLAETPDEWRAALGELIGSPERRAALGRSAFEAARSGHTTSAQANVLYDALARVAGPTTGDRKLTLNVLVGGGGDVRGLSRLAAELGWRGHDVRLAADSVPRDVRPAVEVLEPEARPLPPADANIATDLETARIVVESSQGMFTFLLADAADGLPDDLPMRRLPLGARPDAETLERLLLELCFARLDPTWQGVSTSE